MHSVEFNYAPSTFNNTWTKNNERKIEIELQNNDEYVLPHPRIEFFKKNLLYSLPAAWNAAGTLRFYHNRITFKIALKDKLLSEIKTT
jgi:hypothetical protein